MTNVKLKCISPFQPNEIVEVDESKVKALVETKQYILVEDTVSNTPLKKDLSKKKDYGIGDKSSE